MKAEDIFLAALERTGLHERATYLDRTCGNDAALRSRVEGLLRAHEEAGNVLDQPLFATTAPRGDQSTDDELSLSFLGPPATPGHLGRLGHYEVHEVVGRGGMGVVLKALDEKLHRVVAIKVMAAQLATCAAARKRFSREAQAAAAVSHDHIVTIHAVEETGGLPYLVMQYVSGMSLQERIDKGGPLGLHEVLRIGMQTASALVAAHAQGLIHRDIKPANILLENAVERVKITDFGLARAAADASVTQTGIVAGSPHYMSPEQARGEALDQRSDLFSLGSVLYAMCTGRTPFYGDSTVAILKRVCEDRPTPIREINPEIPDWLVAIIEKLHAKDPAERYQTAAEVADLLGQHLAQLQQPTTLDSAANSVVKSQIPNSKSPIRRRRWALAAAAAAVLLFAGLGLTDATGVTQVVPTVIRIVTGEGTLIVQTDPDVKVTIEGNGNLTFRLAGGQTIRVPTGPYRVKATKDGKPMPLEKDLVTISRGREAVVRVRLESPAAAIASTADRGAFVVLGGDGAEMRKFDTLAAAVQGASDGDTIEIRGNGPFVCEPTLIHASLTIRAGTGYRPILRLSRTAAEAGGTLLSTWAGLTVEGLELQRLDAPPKDKGWPCLITSFDAPLHVAHCRFMRTSRGGTMLSAQGSPQCAIRGCEFVGYGYGLSWTAPEAGRLTVERCVLGTDDLGITLEPASTGKTLFKDVQVRCFANTIVTSWPLNVQIYQRPEELTPAVEQEKRIRLETVGNIFAAGQAPLVFRQLPPLITEHALTGEEGEAFLRSFVSWQGEANLYSPVPDLLHFVKRTSYPEEPVTRPKKLATLADWKAFWNCEENHSILEKPRFRGGNVVMKALNDPEAVTPEDFRLADGSAGKGAGKDGKDLGADIDLVGPGEAYERWKKTPEYQEWLKEAGQVK